MAYRPSPSKRPIAADPDELAFLAGYDASRFPRPSVAVDVVLLTATERELRALLVRRVAPPDKGRWSVPGGFLGVDESLEDAAERVLRDKAGLRGVFLEQLYTFGDVGRDPRTRVISVAYYALVPTERLAAAVGEDAGRVLARLDVAWAGEVGGEVGASVGGESLPLAFDHARILGMAVKRLRGKLWYAPVGLRLVPEAFTLRQLRLVYEAILGRALNKDAFRRRLLGAGILQATGEREGAVGHRPAELYRFVEPAAD